MSDLLVTNFGATDIFFSTRPAFSSRKSRARNHYYVLRPRHLKARSVFISPCVLVNQSLFFVFRLPRQPPLARITVSRIVFLVT